MKLIIDIPDNIYDAIKEAQTIISGQRSGKTLLQILVNSVENGTPLDSVKAEIEKIRLNSARFRTSDGTVVYVDSQNILEVLDNILDRIGKESGGKE